MTAICVSLIWASVVIYLARRKTDLVKEGPVQDTSELSDRIAHLEEQAEELKKTADEAKRLMSNANLAMGFKPYGKRE